MTPPSGPNGEGNPLNPSMPSPPAFDHHPPSIDHQYLLQIHPQQQGPAAVKYRPTLDKTRNTQYRHASHLHRHTYATVHSFSSFLSSASTNTTRSPGAALAQCLQNSDCVMIHRNTPADCLRPPLVDTLPTQCQQLKHGYGQCKRGMIDMRKRFRGNRPISTSTELEGSGKAPMLYAGKGTFDETEKKKIEEGTEYEVFTRNDGSEDLRKK